MAGLEQQFVNHLRKAARNAETYVCVLCKARFPNAGRMAFYEHLNSAHSREAEVNVHDHANFDFAARQVMESHSKCAGAGTDYASEQEVVVSGGGVKMVTLVSKNPADIKSRKLAPRRRTSDEPPDPDRRSRRSPNPRRACAKEQSGCATSKFQSHWTSDSKPARNLFNTSCQDESDAARATPDVTTAPSPRQRSMLSESVNGTEPCERDVLPMPVNGALRKGVISMPIDKRWPNLSLQPDSGPISQEQLAAEVKSTYAGLTMVESKCIHADNAQALAMREGEVTINNGHWQALIALHKTLLHEHHDFFLARQHPSASQALRQLASKYSMPARMWKHGIHSFLELLRYQLPVSLDFMMSFIYTAYDMTSLLYETVPAFSETWSECLGDLGRYRMAIEDEDIRPIRPRSTADRANALSSSFTQGVHMTRGNDDSSQPSSPDDRHSLGQMICSIARLLLARLTSKQVRYWPTLCLLFPQVVQGEQRGNDVLLPRAIQKPPTDFRDDSALDVAVWTAAATFTVLGVLLGKQHRGQIIRDISIWGMLVTSILFVIIRVDNGFPDVVERSILKLFTSAAVVRTRVEWRRGGPGTFMIVLSLFSSTVLCAIISTTLQQANGGLITSGPLSVALSLLWTPPFVDNVMSYRRRPNPGGRPGQHDVHLELGQITGHEAVTASSERETTLPTPPSTTSREEQNLPVHDPNAGNIPAATATPETLDQGPSANSISLPSYFRIERYEQRPQTQAQQIHGAA